MIKLNKSVSLLFFALFSILISGLDDGVVYANPNDTPPPLEEMYTQIGYKSVEEAVKEFENHFKREVKLPFIVPPVPFTHQFGRFNDLDDDLNDSLDIEFINEKSPVNHYKVLIRPVIHKIPIRNKDVLKVIELRNGNDAKFIEVSGFNVLVFESDNWQYMIGIDKRVANQVTSDLLVEIANSIDYVPKRRDSLLK